ncbi:type II toxin-antitoxin system death-on-curing family toxin [Kocuria indica]|uniref:Type II toxin-antitoxin system death-on-curing family toxin n=1 Tax=Kocuria marina subsp. indica TaxID=1049583 RepID=A0A6N9QYQ6_9MICC|nr:type II toxin-antitoxin system death-on-curing family toxin [Kocuria marina]NDO78392.1 type II toxin-antitoxin system death-on-curing family toxin [Kocuria indica]
MTAYPDLTDALYVIDRFGFHVRDVGLLASALARPATTVFGEDAYAAIQLKAAALLESLIRNHALVDGNKRTAWTLMVVFLGLNGYRHDFDTDTAFDLVLAVANDAIPLEESARTLKERLISWP